jgi:hypothetical protein
VIAVSLFGKGVSSLSLNSGTIDLNFTPKKTLKNRDPVVFQEANGKIVSYSLPYVMSFPHFVFVTPSCAGTFSNPSTHRRESLGKTTPTSSPFAPRSSWMR